MKLDGRQGRFLPLPQLLQQLLRQVRVGAAHIHPLLPLWFLVKHPEEPAELSPAVPMEQLLVGGDEAVLQAEVYQS